MLEKGKYYKCIKTLKNPQGEDLFTEGNKYKAVNKYELLNARGKQMLILTANAVFIKHFELEPEDKKETEVPTEHPSPYRLEPHKYDALEGLQPTRNALREEQELLDSFAKIAFGKLLDGAPYDNLISEQWVSYISGSAYRLAEGMIKARKELKL